MYLKKIASDSIRIAEFANKQNGWIELSDDELNDHLTKLAKNDKIADLKQMLNDVRIAGYQYQGNSFDIDNAAIENILLKSQCPSTMSNRYKFYDKDKNQVDFIDDAGFEAFKDAILSRKDYIMVHYNKLYKDIKSCLSISAIEDIVIDFTEPS